MSGTLSAPKLSYEKAMALSFTISVKDCAADVFAALIEHAVQTAKKPEKLQEGLNGLDFSSPIDKWYGLNLLRENGVALPIGG